MNLSVVIPCLNERLALSNMRRMLDEFRTQNRAEPIFTSIEFIIVDDGSSDGTTEVLKSWGDCRLIRHDQPQGYGAALKAGFAAAQGELIGFMDMDSSYVPGEFLKMGRHLIRRNLACVFGSRSQPDSGMPGLRKFGNRLYVHVLRALCGSSLSDVCTGQRIFRRELLPLALSLRENDLSYSVAFTVALLKSQAPIEEIKIRYLIRDGESKLSVVNDGVGFFMAILRTKYKVHAAQRRHLN